ncbi:tetratricopeptide repeat protein [Tundrisphaera lichenicola]|uniref:tetratricopeptide repeat protein n=1 Tax=Tundrisphaera lichenicola TaxID=2029860 RepID=UPI003EBF74E6
MRRSAVIAGCCVALGLLPGCAAVRQRRELAAEAPEMALRRQQLSQAATSAMDRGDYPQARADLEKLLVQTPSSAELHYRLGKVLQFQNDLGGAENEFRRALILEPHYVGALVGLGQIDARMDRPAEALCRFEKAIEVEPHRAEAHFARGKTLETLGRRDDALAAYFRSLELDPASPPAIVRVAAIQLDRGQPEQALVRLDQATELSPEDADVRFQRGLTLLALNRPGSAISDLKFAAENLTGRADVLLVLARAFEADRKPEQARLAAERALHLQPESPVAREISERLRR